MQYLELLSPCDGGNTDKRKDHFLKHKRDWEGERIELEELKPVIMLFRLR